ncbi:MAG: ribosome-associated translation inhibitor RaiA, partial [Coriobacteriia bacterium]|nr:ribosome-associated translation inhibitor RaiA [Coriobacteriia bacterium]
SRKSPNACEITLRTKGHIIRTEASDEDVKAAVDIATAKLERQLRKFKTKVVDKRQNAAKLADVLESGLMGNGNGANGASAGSGADVFDALEDDDQLVRVKEIDLAVLSTDEALLEMDLLGHDFYVYIAAEDGTTCVLYRRHSGGYGMLKPLLETIAE